MFTEKIYIRKNTPFLRNKLKQLGHTLCVCTEFEDAKILTVTNQPNVYRSVHGWGYTEHPHLTQEEILEDFYKTTSKYDCGENEDLFLALAALRDDSDFMQLFILLEDYGAEDYGFIPKGTLHLCKAEKIHQYFPVGMRLRKATKQEIIDFYNNPENINTEFYLKSDFLDLEINKQLIINDLLPRIPYQTKCHVDIQGLLDSNLEYKEIFERASKVQDNLFNKLNDKAYTLFSYFGDGAFYFLGFESMDDYGIDASLIKPYLIPIDEMTDKQKEEYCALQEKVIYNSKGPVSEDINNLMIFIYKNHIDYNDLISKGLALNAIKYNVY